MHTSASTVALLVSVIGPAIINAAPVVNNGVTPTLPQTPSAGVPSQSVPPNVEAPKVRRHEVNDIPKVPVDTPKPELPAPLPKVPRQEVPKAPLDTPKPELPAPAPKVPRQEIPKVPLNTPKPELPAPVPKVPRNDVPKAPVPVATPEPEVDAHKQQATSAIEKAGQAHKRATGKSSPVGIQHKNRPFHVPSPVHGPATPRPVYRRSDEAVAQHVNQKLPVRSEAEVEVSLDDVLEIEVEVGKLDLEIALCSQGKLDAQYITTGTLSGAESALVSAQAELEAKLEAYGSHISDNLIDLEIEVGQLELEIELCQAGKLAEKYINTGSLSAAINFLAKLQVDLEAELSL